MIVTVRLPRAWRHGYEWRERCFRSADVQRFLVAYLNRPRPLPADPGAGELRVSLWLDRQQVRMLAVYLDCGVGEAVRRLIAGSVAQGQQEANRAAIAVVSGPGQGKEGAGAVARPVGAVVNVDAQLRADLATLRQEWGTGFDSEIEIRLSSRYPVEQVRMAMQTVR